MPSYTFLDTATGEEATHAMKMAEYDDFIAANPTLQRVYCSAPGVGDPIRLGVTRTPDSWKSLLKHVNKEHKNVLSGGTNVNIR